MMKKFDGKITISDVVKSVRDVLSLEENIELNAGTLIKDLRVEPIDILNIYFRLGIKFTDYISGEKLRDKGKERLLNIADANLYCCKCETYKDVIHFIKLGMSNTANEFINQLTLGDLVSIKNYEIDEERIRDDAELNMMNMMMKKI